jgi:chemotaxis protein histidine kinase CheA
MNQKDIASKVFVYLKLIREVDLFRYGKSYIAVTAGLFTYSSSQEGYIPAKMYGPRAQLLAYFKPEDEIIIEGYFTKINDEYEIIIEAVSSFRLDKIDRKKGQERLEKAAKVKARFPDVVCLLRSEADPLKRQIPRIENTDIELSQVSLSDEWVILGTPRLNPEDLLYATYYYQVDVGYEEQVEDDVSEQECEQECEQELEKASKQEQVDQEESNEESNYELIKLLQSLEESEQELEKASKQEQVNQEESNQELLQSLGESELQLEKEQVNQEESNEESNQEQVKEQESDPEEAERRKFLEEKQKLLEQFFLIFQLIDFHMYEEEMSRPKKELLDDLFEEDFQIYYNGGWHKLT